MHITKIISGGQTGAEQAALDTAIDLGFDHCGSLGGGQLIEKGSLSEKYNPTQIPAKSRLALAEKNVVNSDGTVIFFLGSLGGEAALAAEWAKRHGKPWLHIDVSRAHPLKASGQMLRWIAAEDLRVLNIADSGSSHDPGTYNRNYRAMWGLLALDSIDGDLVTDTRAFKLKAPASKALIWPEDLEELVEFLENCLPFGQRFNISRMNEQQLAGIQRSIEGWIQETFGLWLGNDKLLHSAERWTLRKIASPEDASWIVIRALASRVRRNHLLR